MTIVLLLLVWVALIVWVVGVMAQGCRHERLHGVANYYDDDLRVFIHLKECEDCHMSIITHER